jgi:hypothetical protein
MSVTKTENGMEFPAEAYAYVPDVEKPDTWKLRMWESPEAKATVAQLGRAAAALSPGGFRGQQAQIPAEHMAAVTARIRAEYKRLGVKPEEMPHSMMASQGPRFVITLSAEAVPAEGLMRIPLAKLGTWWKGKVKFSITRADMASLVANFRKQACDLVVDYDHSTEYAAGTGAAAPAAGWLKSIEDGPDADGVLYGYADFTMRAREMIAAKEYRYVSPVIAWGKRDVKTGLQQGAMFTSIALTNIPLLEEMPAIALSQAGWMEERTMAVKKVILSDRAAGKVRVIHEDDTETTLSIEGLEPEVKVVRLADVKRDANGKLDFASVAASNGVLLASEVIHFQAVQSELDEAVRAGKITPAQRPIYERMAMSDLEGFRTLAASMRPQVPLGEKGVAGTGDEQLDDEPKVDGRLNELVKQKIAANQKLSPAEAYKLVLAEHPGLAKRKQELMLG